MHTLVIINPISGKAQGTKIFQNVSSILTHTGRRLEVVRSNYRGEITHLAMNLDSSQYNEVIIIGGDGSLNEFVNGMLARSDGFRFTVGLIPAGTGNSLLHDLHQLDPLEAVQSIVEEGRRKIDLARIQSGHQIFYAFNVVGWGLPSTINQKSENWKWLGSQRYNMASLQEIIRNPNWPVKIELDGHQINGNYSFFMACNTIHTGKGMKVAPLAKLDDGKIDIVMLRSASRLRLIKLFSKIFKGEHLNDPLVEYHQVEKFSVSEDRPSILIIDGQVEGFTPFKVEILKQELEILN